MSKKAKNIRAAVAITILLALAVCFALNIYYACKSGSDANIFTAIGGWIGFLATAGVGAITIYQNKKSENKIDRQNKTEALVSFKTYIYDDYNRFVGNRSLVAALEGVMQLMTSHHFDEQDKEKDDAVVFEEELARQRIDFILINYLEFCECQANDINNARFNFAKLVDIHKAILELNIIINKIIGAHYGTKECSMLETCVKIFSRIRDLYTELLIDLENMTERLNNADLSYNEFSDIFDRLKKLDDIRKKIEHNMELYRKETQNGQTEDDVDGQGE